jgi:hypothetical protein
MDCATPEMIQLWTFMLKYINLEYCMRLNMTAIAFPQQQNSYFS